ncbi:MAG: hypothetical protein WC044_10320 [Crocinitomicaceae bacterium]
MKTFQKLSALLFVLSFLTSCNKESSNRRKMAGEYSVEKIEFYTINANNEPVLTSARENIGTITLLNNLHGGADYEFNFTLDTLPEGFHHAWVHDDAFGAPVSRGWSIDNGKRDLLIIDGRDWYQKISVYSNYTVEKKHGKHSTWTYYYFDNNSSTNYGKKEILYLKKTK